MEVTRASRVAGGLYTVLILRLRVFAMLYWYAIRGDAVRRGCADDLVLLEMARKGTLKPQDLVWCVSGGTRWVPASTIEGLFPKQEPVAAEPAGREAEGRRTARRRWLLPAAAVAAIVALGAAAFFVLMPSRPAARRQLDSDFLKPLQLAASSSVTPVRVREAVLASARSNAVAALRDRIAVCFDQARLDEAEKLIAELKRQDGGAEHAARLSASLDVLRRSAEHRKKLEAALKDGSIDGRGAAELLQLFSSAAPSDRKAWVELAAVMCVKGNSDGAMKALRQGISIGGDDARAAARSDARFETLREVQDFRNLVSPGSAPQAPR